MSTILVAQAFGSPEPALSPGPGTLSFWGPRGWGRVARGQHKGAVPADLLQRRSIGAKEETGFTKESTRSPIVFQPPSQALPGDPVRQAGPHWTLRVIEAVRSGDF